jgi:hypothetical protein
VARPPATPAGRSPSGWDGHPRRRPRELARNGGAAGIGPNALRPPTGKPPAPSRPSWPWTFGCAPVVEAKLALCWSSEQIAGWLQMTYPNDATMRISHETIYLRLYVQDRRALRGDLRRCLHRPGDAPPAWQAPPPRAAVSSSTPSRSAGGPPLQPAARSQDIAKATGCSASPPRRSLPCSSGPVVCGRFLGSLAMKGTSLYISSREQRSPAGDRGRLRPYVGKGGPVGRMLEAVGISRESVKLFSEYLSGSLEFGRG